LYARVIAISSRGLFSLGMVARWLRRGEAAPYERFQGETNA
jgi:hypothetical protein